ncbi:Uncharacterised protein family protein [Methylomagnum ishizawai]|uniref:Uncharacterized protein YtcA n=2 Tax=Methylomagnum ishizawai TaxID=1760988 RepID=A0A1Y6CXJ9_9GAMM|nr:Uncharacterised protein family protein [Methylomagnum ishizawai]
MPRSLAWAGPLLLTGCDPLLSVQGSFWPPWIVCMLSGLVLAAAASLAFSALKLSPYLGNPLITYTALWALLTFTIWLVGYAV